MAEHPLHEAVGGLLKELAREKGFVVRLDDDCGGDQHIPLFLASKSNETCLCKVDAMLLKEVNGSKEVVAVIEIEESGIIPTKICGKFLTTALSSEYDHENDGNVKFKPKSIKFIHIVDTSSLDPKSDKPAKLSSIERLIRNILPSFDYIKSYDIIIVNYNDLKNKLSTILNGESK
jgi:hypothetical protein